MWHSVLALIEHFPLKIMKSALWILKFKALKIDLEIDPSKSKFSNLSLKSPHLPKNLKPPQTAHTTYTIKNITQKQINPYLGHEFWYFLKSSIPRVWWRYDFGSFETLKWAWKSKSCILKLKFLKMIQKLIPQKSKFVNLDKNLHFLKRNKPP